MDENEKCKNCCFTPEEREWLHTSHKYIDSKHLPMMGKCLKIFDDLSYAIGKAVLGTIIIAGTVLLFWWVFVKAKWGG
jgi:hypothetical protein